MGGNQIETWNLCFQDGYFERKLPQENRIETLLQLLFVNSEPPRGICLWIQIDQKNPQVCEGQLAGQVNGGSGLSDPPFLITNCDGSGHVPRGTPVIYALAFAKRSAATCCTTVRTELTTQYSMKPEGRW